MNSKRQISYAVVGLVSLAVLGCSLEALLMPFGSYYYFSRGLTGAPSDLDTLWSLLGNAGSTIGGTASDGTDGTTDGTTNGGTDTSGSVPNVNDNFDDGNLDAWAVLSGNWFVTNSGAAQATGPALQGYNMMVIGQDDWTDYEFSVDIQLDAGAEYAVGVRFQNDQTWYHCSHTLVGIASIWKFVAGQPDQQLTTGASIPLPPGEFYNFRVVVQGNTITFHVEGEQVASATDASSPISSGKVALLVAAGAIINFDNVRVSRIGG